MGTLGVYFARPGINTIPAQYWLFRGDPDSLSIMVGVWHSFNVPLVANKDCRILWYTLGH